MTFYQKYNELNFDETVYRVKLSKVISLLKTRGPNYINEVIDFLENDAANLIDIIFEKEATIHSLENEVDDLQYKYNSAIDELGD